MHVGLHLHRGGAQLKSARLVKVGKCTCMWYTAEGPNRKVRSLSVVFGGFLHFVQKNTEITSSLNRKH